jgi:hypothetical protein
VAGIHARHEDGEGSLAGLALPLVEVVRHVIGQQREHRLAVSPVESGVIVGHEGDGGFGSGAVHGRVRQRCSASLS